MTFHPHREQFAAAEAACNAVMAATVMKAGPLDTSAAAADLHWAEAWYQYEANQLRSMLDTLGITPLAVLRTQHWERIRDRLGLYQFEWYNGSIHLQLPNEWRCDFKVASQAAEWRGWKKDFTALDAQAFADAATLPHAELLAKLMPNHTALPHDEDVGPGAMHFDIDLPPAPPREAEVIEILQEAGIPIMFAAEPAAIAFHPPLSDQMRERNAEVALDALMWRDEEPMVLVPHKRAVAISAQWGDFVLEAEAVTAAVAAQ